MRFLIDANLPRRTGDIVVQAGHEAVDVRAIGLGGAADSVIAAHARAEMLAIISRDSDFGDIRNYPPADYAGLVVLSLPDELRRRRGAPRFAVVSRSNVSAGATSRESGDRRAGPSSSPQRLIDQTQ